MSAFDPWNFKTPFSKHWGWLYVMIGLIPFLIVLGTTFYVLSLLMTDEDLYYKKNTIHERYTYSTLSYEFANIEIAGEMLPHFLLMDENDKFINFQFRNNTYFKDMTYNDGEKKKNVRFEELYHYALDSRPDVPVLNFKEEYIPFGDSKSSCFHVRFRANVNHSFLFR
jgi:hypothetical protein